MELDTAGSFFLNFNVISVFAFQGDAEASWGKLVKARALSKVQYVK